ncbi:MAG: hypothetical protein AAB250_02145 [Bdellovibrionota bacterium]
MFELLALREHADLSAIGKEPTVLNKELKLLRSELCAWRENERIVPSVRTVSTPDIYQVYAALGSTENGAALEEIVARTRLKSPVIIRALEVMSNQRMVTIRESRYYAVAVKLDFLDLKNRDAVSALIGSVGSNIQKRKNEIAQDPTSATFYTAFSISRSRRGQLAERLRDAVFGVLDQFQDDDGDEVQQLFFCLHRNS